MKDHANDGATSVLSPPPSPAAENIEDAGGSRPVLLIHIPKTAGTSFLLMLQNAFGDNRVRRITNLSERVQDAIDVVIEAELDQLSCLAGHLPLYLLQRHLSKFHTFTVLREPVDRILSLYRFLRRGPVSEIDRLELPRDFSISEMLESPHPELHGQVNNGMVRMLCGDSRLDNPDEPSFWNMGASAEPSQQALANLQQMNFGLTEDMAGTLHVAETQWAVPYTLRQYRENVTLRNGGLDDITVLHRIISMNTLDLALYHQARTIFRNRTLDGPHDRRRAYNPRTVFKPVLDQEISVGDMPGRQGFHEYEPLGFAWLHADQPAEINFLPPVQSLRLRLHVYCVVPRYPVADVLLAANGEALRTDFFFVNQHWCWLQTERFEPGGGLSRLTIQAPMFVPTSQVEPGSKDDRRLGIALAGMVFSS